jgi:putative tricarboxylic transport membrane protein
LKLGGDGWAGLAVLIASLVLFWLTLGLHDSPLVPIGPGFYPRIILGVTAVLAALLVLSDRLWPRAPSAARRIDYGVVAAMYLMFGVYAGALPFLGFRIATFLYVVAANALLDPPRAPRAWLRAALVGLLTAAATYYVFEHYLLVLLPRGAWTDF